ncbi:MAG: methyl-accepting chemotaxis protein [Aquabacterium sp.]
MSLFALMRGFTIRIRMFGAIGVVLALLLMVGGVGVYGLLHSADVSASYQTSSFTEVTRLSRMREALGQVRMHEQRMLLAAGDATSLGAAANDWRAAVSRLKELTQGLLQGEADEDNPIAEATLRDLAQYQQGLEAQQAALGTAGIARDAAQNAIAPSVKLAQTLTAHLEAIDGVMTAEARQAHDAQERNVRDTLVLFLGAVLLSLLIVVPTTIVNQMCICEPIDRARHLALSIAQGHLNNTVATHGKDEAADLLRALDEMQHSLRATVSDVRISADAISVASSEIASGNMDLSTRTENTASSLQETSGSMQHLTGTVEHSADAARQANELAQGAATAAHRGNSIVNEVVANMDEIDGTSRRINDIIGVIDGIAFQTNILALNAAVEAARAGEQGRGFAVVAGEVRSLAQRSATAAREIKQLILASGQKVESGTKLVHDAGAAMQEIITSVQRVSDIIGEISGAATEQSTGIAQVNQAVTNLDHMTQQNAALVEQSAAAAASLKDQALKLTRAMSVFDV